jgi:hypothetical protein
VLQAAAIGESGQVLVLDMGEPVRIVELACQLIRLSGYSDKDIVIETVDFGQEKGCTKSGWQAPTLPYPLRTGVCAWRSFSRRAKRRRCVHVLTAWLRVMTAEHRFATC